MASLKALIGTLGVSIGTLKVLNATLQTFNVKLETFNLMLVSLEEDTKPAVTRVHAHSTQLRYKSVDLTHNRLHHAWVCRVRKGSGHG
jgi:hypothetical protein